MVVNTDRLAAKRAKHSRLEELFAKHHGELMRFATRRVGPDLAGDVVASTFLIAWRRLSDIPHEHPRAWLYATARNVIANEMRSQRRRDALGARVGLMTKPTQDDPAGLVDERLRIRAVLDSLSPRDQEVLKLTEWEQLSITEASLVMGCTRAALKVRLHRARRRFAAQLYGEGISETDQQGNTRIATASFRPTLAEREGTR
jgi:RNA polymerase sigma-70 factor (ECF subfamily)